MRNPVRPCAVCRRATRGFGWFDPTRRRPPRPTTSFCSMACQALWTTLAARSSPAVVDLNEQEQAAIRATMRPLGECLGEIGWQTRLIDLTEPQVLTLIEVAVGGFQEAMQATARQAHAPNRPLSAADAPF
jgi:hypothetical protein